MIDSKYWSIAAVVAGGFLLVTLCGCSGSGQSREQAAIQRILDTDHQLGNSVTGSTASDIAISIQSYVAQANALDMSDCPADFRLSYRRHLGAWSRAATCVNELPDGIVDGLFMGTMNSLFRGEMDGGQSRLEGNLAAAEEDIRVTWYAVEDVALSHGVAR